MRDQTKELREMLIEAISVLVDYASEAQVEREALLASGDDYCESDMQRLNRAESVIQKYRTFKVTQGQPSEYA